MREKGLRKPRAEGQFIITALGGEVSLGFWNVGFAVGSTHDCAEPCKESGPLLREGM